MEPEVIFEIGDRVTRGPDWEWKHQGGRDPAGTVIGIESDGWVEVRWDIGDVNVYRTPTCSEPATDLIHLRDAADAPPSLTGQASDDDLVLTKATQGRLIGFGGLAGSGKSTAADVLVADGWKRIKFADPLKNMLRSFYITAGLSFDEVERRIEGDLKEEEDDFLLGRTPRQAMQNLGDAWGRMSIHVDLWTEAWRSAVLKAFSEGLNVVTDDVRYQNEVNTVRSLGGLVYRIERGVQFVTKGSHPSEKLEFNPDAVLLNNSEPGEFADKVRRIFL